MSKCEDCGIKVQNGVCRNCQEEIFIEEQYEELGIAVPEQISKVAEEQRKKLKVKP